MSEDWSRYVALPNDRFCVVACTSPFGTDVRVDANCVRRAIRRNGLHSEVRKRSGLFHEVRGLVSR